MLAITVSVGIYLNNRADDSIDEGSFKPLSGEIEESSRWAARRDDRAASAAAMPPS